MESAIHILPDDLLLNIFSVNADMNRRILITERYFTPLNMTRLSSQVCKHWRHLILGCPTLWAGILNLNDLISGSDTWANEILSRTKEAMLNVRVVLRENTQAVTSLFFKILDEEWPRIQHLVASVDAYGDYNDDRWLSLHRPTENLRSIALSFPLQPPEPLRSTTNILFSDRAPSLRSLGIYCLDFQLPAPWFSQLSTLYLEGHFEPDGLMESLSAMPLLEILDIFNTHRGHPKSRWPTIFRPHLKALAMTGCLAASLMVLDHIMPPPGCGLDFSNCHSLIATEPDLTTISRVLPRYCEGYFKKYDPHAIELTLGSTQFIFGNRIEFVNRRHMPRFEVRIDHTYGFSSMSSLFKSFLGCPFSKVSLLSLNTEEDLTSLLSDPIFSAFISMLSSLDYLMATPAGLNYLLLNQSPAENGMTLLPSLKTVRITSLDVYPESSAAQVTQFLLWLKSAGRSIQALIIGHQVDLTDHEFDFSPLEQFSGLRVAWTEKSHPTSLEREYICGSGTPERLDFRVAKMNAGLR